MKNALPTVAVAAALCCTAFVPSAFAQEAKITPVAQFEEDSGAQERINFSGKLRMLSQRIPSAACHLAAGVEVEASKKLLMGASAEFSKIVNALQFGDPELNITGAEERRKTVAKIDELRVAWVPMKKAADAMLAGDTSDAQLKPILDANMGVLKHAAELVSVIVGQYSNPNELVQADSMLIDLAGRQRMLTQKMSKESCMVATGYGTADTVEALNGTVTTFDTSLSALTSGMPALGIRRPPSAGIEAGLVEVAKHWNKAKPMLEQIAAGSALNADDDAKKFTELNVTMKTMNEVVGMYAKALKKEG
ncbi:MAG: type IV pili methyl-accepting chemotaxis transducer N-terminal domain-containing protein [Litoreibacter sp.]|nr:type IV pili methyl-accepting chemotaxis transducer N-terminal domain-containing protein [Litoreibacter sp.]MCY4333126.1 type IV pili methyl-accepting chemotaxis transducer N-terminal domain-containing protein [Litoreibacter sp.]